MRTRNIVIIIASCCALVLLVAGLSIWLVYSMVTGRMFGYEPPPTPPQLKEARVVVGPGFLTRSVFAETGAFKTNKDIGGIGEVRVGEFDPHPGLDVVVAADEGAIIFDRNGVNHGQTVFHFPIVNTKVGPFSSPHADTMMGDLQVVDLEGDGVCEYIARGGIHGAALFDHRGTMLWTYGKYTEKNVSINDLTVGDLDGDGVAELVVSWHGIEVFDKSGNPRAHVPEEYGDTQIEVVDTNGDGKNEIVSVGGSLKIRNASGEVTEELPIDGYFGNFALCNMPGRKEPLIFKVYDDKVLLIDFEGKTVAEFKAPLSDFPDTVQKTPLGDSFGTSVYKSRGVWIKLAADQPEYLAAIKEFAAIDRSVLDVYTPTGQLVYQEVLPEECLSLAVLPAADASGAPGVTRVRQADRVALPAQLKEHSSQ